MAFWSFLCLELRQKCEKNDVQTAPIQLHRAILFWRLSTEAGATIKCDRAEGNSSLSRKASLVGLVLWLVWLVTWVGSSQSVWTPSFCEDWTVSFPRRFCLDWSFSYKSLQCYNLALDTWQPILRDGLISFLFRATMALLGSVCLPHTLSFQFQRKGLSFWEVWLSYNEEWLNCTA